MRPLHCDPLRFCRPPVTSAEERHALIAAAAYQRAEQRNFASGHSLDDWLAAEAEVDLQLARGPRWESRTAW